MSNKIYKSTGLPDFPITSPDDTQPYTPVPEGYVNEETAGAMMGGMTVALITGRVRVINVGGELYYHQGDLEALRSNVLAKLMRALFGGGK